MSERNSDDEEMGREIVPYGSTKTTIRRKSLVESFLSTDHSPKVLFSIGCFTNVMTGRLFFLQSSNRADELMLLPQDEFDAIDPNLGAITTYNTLLMASSLKKSLQTHHFNSKHCVNLLGSNHKRRKRTDDPDSLYKCKIQKSLGSICDAALDLENIILTEKKLYLDALKSDLEYPEFLSTFQTQTEDLKSCLKEQVVNKELKEAIEVERDEIKFVGELCSRLLAITPFSTSKIKNAFLVSGQIMNHVNGVFKP
ncbi:hypothetical protein GE061_004863 [Apolygus lucorum]|uniref:Uncharacterized protein n=1 Tax=Apolygus lucorum TaxID=248454 RepID=A0A6A4J6A8_APOLU|nr:hypothetical protein GE061_004863 [Apolygus lucorum]